MSANLKFSWPAVLVDEGIKNYRFCCNGIIISNTKLLNYTFSDIAPNKEYYFYVKAITNSGRVSKKSNVVYFNSTPLQIKQLNYTLNFTI